MAKNGDRRPSRVQTLTDSPQVRGEIVPRAQRRSTLACASHGVLAPIGIPATLHMLSRCQEDAAKRLFKIAGGVFGSVLPGRSCADPLQTGRHLDDSLVDRRFPD